MEKSTIVAYFHYQCNQLGVVPQSSGWISETMGRIRKKNKISFRPPETWCAYCRDFEDLCMKQDWTDEEQRRFEECMTHFVVKNEQRKQYRADIAALEAGTSEFSEVFHMDFSQIQGDTCAFIHDMILVVYTRHPTGGLHHFYRHYVARSSSISNDTGFMRRSLDKALNGKVNHSKLF